MKLQCTCAVSLLELGACPAVQLEEWGARNQHRLAIFDSYLDGVTCVEVSCSVITLSRDARHYRRACNRCESRKAISTVVFGVLGDEDKKFAAPVCGSKV